MTPFSVLVFSVVMGSLWLATVPLTSGLVAYLFGLRYMGTLYGLVFFHISWVLFLASGLVDLCMMFLVLTQPSGGRNWHGLISILIHLPISEKPRPAPAIVAT